MSEALPGQLMGVHATGATLMEDRGCGYMAQAPVLTQAILGGPLNASQKFWWRGALAVLETHSRTGFPSFPISFSLPPHSYFPRTASQ